MNTSKTLKHLRSEDIIERKREIVRISNIISKKFDLRFAKFLKNLLEEQKDSLIRTSGYDILRTASPTSSTVKYFLFLLKSEVEEARRLVAESIGYVFSKEPSKPYPSVEKLLIKMLKDKSRNVRVSSIEALGKCGSASSKDIVIKILINNKYEDGIEITDRELYFILHSLAYYSKRKLITSEDIKKLIPSIKKSSIDASAELLLFASEYSPDVLTVVDEEAVDKIMNEVVRISFHIRYFALTNPSRFEDTLKKYASSYYYDDIEWAFAHGSDRLVKTVKKIFEGKFPQVPKRLVYRFIGKRAKIFKNLLLNQLKSKDYEIVTLSLWVLVENGIIDAKSLSPYVSSRSNRIRRETSLMLSNFAFSEVKNYLLELLSDEDESVRNAAFISLLSYKRIREAKSIIRDFIKKNPSSFYINLSGIQYVG